MCNPFSRSVRRRSHGRGFYKYTLLLTIIVFSLWWIFKQLQKFENTLPDIFNQPELFRPDQTPAEQELIRQRRKAKIENTDEFLEEVLMEYKYTEADLSLWPAKIKENAVQDQIYDKEIQAYFDKIIPGLGNEGHNASVPESQTAMAAEVMKREAANIMLSDLISPNRTLPDTRMDACLTIKYSPDLPDASIVIIYHDESFSTLLRSIHSVMNRSPPHLLKEIILVDDFSDKEELKGRLERYLTTQLPLGKIRHARIHKRAGLIRARMIGAHLATGTVIVFLDAHCEVGYTWLEPLLERIKEKRTAVVCPTIEMIYPDNFGILALGNEILVAGWSWNLYFHWMRTKDQYEVKGKKFHHSPTKSPGMAGGLFAIDRNYFWEIGSYDSGMKLWGGENLELSFRVWQCGGSVEIIPCSRVEHIFHSTHPHSPGHEKSHYINAVRLAEVWMDDYKELFYTQCGFKTSNFGDVSRRRALRERLKCKNFSWYLQNVFKERYWKPGGWSHYGQVKNPATNRCLDNYSHDGAATDFRLELFDCHKETNVTKDINVGCQVRLMPPERARTPPELPDFPRVFMLSDTGELRRDLVCATSRANDSLTYVHMVKCENLPSTGEPWEYNNLTLKNLRTDKCLMVKDLNGTTKLILEKCNSSLPVQQWSFEAAYTTEIK